MKLLLVGIALAWSAAACAGDTWAVMTLWSYHEHGGDRYRQDNYGIGLERDLTDNVRAVVGQYRNSFDRNSVYAGLQWRFCGESVVRLCAGATAGFVSGYAEEKAQLYRPGIVPTLMAEGNRLGANLHFGRTPNNGWVFGLQVKVKTPF